MPGAKLQPNNPANDPDLKPVKGHSKFVPNMSLYKTHRYGIIEPHFAFEPVPDDKNVSYRSGTDVDTQNLKAPLMTPLKLNKDTLFVPLSAILPHNWELLETNPLSGQDINPLQVNTIWGDRGDVVNGIGYFATELMKILNGTYTYADSKCYLTALLAWSLNYYQHGSPVFSYGSLAQSLGYNFAADYYGFYIKNRAHRTDFDETIEILFSEIKRGVKSFRCGLFQPKFTSNTPSLGYDLVYVNVVVSATENSVVSGSGGLTLRSFLELLEQGSLIFRIENLQVQDNFVDVAFDPTLYGIENLSTTTLVSLNTVLSSSFSRVVNISRLIAYQLVCASYFTDDAVDYVYTSKLWHQNMMALFCGTVNSTSSIYGYTHYTLNGVNMEYDSVSRAILDRICMSYQSLLYDLSDYSSNFHINSSGDPTQPLDPYYQNMVIYGSALKGAVAYEYFNNIFGYQRALRYRDYFVGARPNPLAVGDVTVAVNQNLVDVVDVTKKIQMQRFLNQVNRVGRRISDYAAGIFGVAPRKDNDEPIFLSHVSMTIGAEETSNTGPSQLEMAQTTTSKLRKDSSNFIFSTDFSSFGVIIGVTTVEMIRPLPNAADRQLFHADRFDMFNPYMQHVGDQEVYQAELDPIVDATISYKLRYSEYKMRTDRMAGGFVSQQFLPGFAFPITSDDLANPLSNSAQLKISPDFIRQKPHEFDKFFNALPFNSMAGYFHFIIRHDNEVSALRPMEAAPSIL